MHSGNSLPGVLFVMGLLFVGHAADGQDLRQSPVHHLHFAKGTHHDVGRLQIAMDHSGLVGGMDSPGQGRQQLRGHLRRLRTTLQELVQAASGQVFQGEIGSAFPFAHFVNLHDVRMLQAGRRLRLRPEAGQQFRRHVGLGVDRDEHHRPIQRR